MSYHSLKKDYIHLNQCSIQRIGENVLYMVVSQELGTWSEQEGYVNAFKNIILPLKPMFYSSNRSRNLTDFMVDLVRNSYIKGLVRNSYIKGGV